MLERRSSGVETGGEPLVRGGGQVEVRAGRRGGAGGSQRPLQFAVACRGRELLGPDAELLEEDQVLGNGWVRFGEADRTGSGVSVVASWSACTAGRSSSLLTAQRPTMDATVVGKWMTVVPDGAESSHVGGTRTNSAAWVPVARWPT